MKVPALLLALALAGCAGAGVPSLRSFERPPAGYAAVESGEVRAEIIRMVEEYYTVRARAVAAWDVAILYARFPRLATGEDRARLVNIDAWFIERMRAHGVRTVTTKSEDREPMRVYVRGGDAAVFVHGRFDWIEIGTAGEFYTRIDLERDGTWTVVRTDEVSEAEAHER